MVQGVRIGRRGTLSHLMFVDDVLLFFFGSKREVSSFRDILHIYKKATKMEINNAKSALYSHELSEQLETTLRRYLHFQSLDINEGVNYFGFFSKPNNMGRKIRIGL